MHPAELGELEAFRDLYACCGASFVAYEARFQLRLRLDEVQPPGGRRAGAANSPARGGGSALRQRRRRLRGRRHRDRQASGRGAGSPYRNIVRAGFEAQYVRANYLSSPEADTSGAA
jgi:hypothetical protein